MAEKRWKLTRCTGTYDGIVRGSWIESDRLYRWRWQAELAAFLYAVGKSPRLMTKSIIAPYVQGVDPLPALRIVTVKRSPGRKFGKPKPAAE